MTTKINPPCAGQKSAYLPYQAPEVSIPSSVAAYVLKTSSGLPEGGRQMFESTYRFLDKALPYNEFLGETLGWDKADTFIAEVAFFGVLIALGVLYLPAAVMTGVMFFGISAALVEYSRGLGVYQSALLQQNSEAEQQAIQKGEEAGFEMVLGGSLLGISRVPTFARVARTICLADDPVFLQIGVERLAGIVQ